MNSLKLSVAPLLFLLLAAGCAERRTVYVPAYQQPATVYQTQPTYSYPPQSTYQSQPLVTQNPAGSEQAPQPQPQQAPPSQVVVSQAPPPPPTEVVTVAPGPDYAWAPGYWNWNGGWVWVSGGWVLRPRPHAIWVGPRWVHRGHGYVYMRGHWR